MGAVVWPGLAWATQKARKGSAGNRVGRGEGAALQAPNLDVAPPLQGPCLFLLCRVWRAFSLSVSIYQVEEGTEASGTGGYFSGPHHHMTPGPRPSWKCWLQLPAESWHQPALPGEAPGCLYGSFLCSWYPQLSVSPELSYDGRHPAPSASRGTSICPLPC